MLQRAQRMLSVARPPLVAASVCNVRNFCRSSTLSKRAVGEFGWMRSVVKFSPLQSSIMPTGVRFFSSFPSHTALAMPALSPTMTQGNIGMRFTFTIRGKRCFKCRKKIKSGITMFRIVSDLAFASVCPFKTSGWSKLDRKYLQVYSVSSYRILSPETLRMTTTSR